LAAHTCARRTKNWLCAWGGIKNKNRKKGGGGVEVAGGPIHPGQLNIAVRQPQEGMGEKGRGGRTGTHVRMQANKDAPFHNCQGKGWKIKKEPRKKDKQPSVQWENPDGSRQLNTRSQGKQGRNQGNVGPAGKRAKWL